MRAIKISTQTSSAESRESCNNLFMFWAVEKTKPKVKTKASYIRSLQTSQFCKHFATKRCKNLRTIRDTSEMLSDLWNIPTHKTYPSNLVTVFWITSQKCLYIIYIKNLHLEYRHKVDKNELIELAYFADSPWKNGTTTLCFLPGFDDASKRRKEKNVKWVQK